MITNTLSCLPVRATDRLICADPEASAPILINRLNQILTRVARIVEERQELFKLRPRPCEVVGERRTETNPDGFFPILEKRDHVILRWTGGNGKRSSIPDEPVVCPIELQEPFRRSEPHGPIVVLKKRKKSCEIGRGAFVYRQSTCLEVKSRNAV